MVSHCWQLLNAQHENLRSNPSARSPDMRSSHSRPPHQHAVLGICLEIFSKATASRHLFGTANIPVAIAAILFWGTPAAKALQNSSNFNAQVNIVGGCAVTVEDLDFGTVGTLDSDITASATIEVVCANFTPYLLSLNPTTIRRTVQSQLVGPGNPIAYRVRLSNLLGFGNRRYRLDGTVPSQSTPQSGVYIDVQTVYVTY